MGIKDALNKVLFTPEEKGVSTPRAGTGGGPSNFSTALRQGPSATIFTKVTGASPVGGDTTDASSIPQEVDNDFDRAIGEQLDTNAKLPGFTEFQAQMQALEEDVPDEARRVKAAVKAVAAAHHVTSQQIRAAVEERLKLLGQEEATFNEDAQRSEEDELSDKSQELRRLGNESAAKQGQISQLQKEKDLLDQQAASLQKEIGGVSDKFKAYRGRFMGAATARKRLLEGILTKLGPLARNDKEKR